MGILAVIMLLLCMAASLPAAMSINSHALHYEDRMAGGLTWPQRQYDSGEFMLSSMDAHAHAHAQEQRDLEALLSFRKAITSDLSGKFSNWTAENSDNVCSWHGVRCWKHTKRVVGIDLHGDYTGISWLEGTLSESLGNLSLLSTLNLSHNSFSGNIPPQFGQLKALLVLDLSSNLLVGSIPVQLGLLQKLEYLHLDSNGFSGIIPRQLGNLTQLTQLSISGLNIRGSIPSEIFRLPLTYLSLSLNLTGTIPKAIGNLTRLTYLSFYGMGVNKIPEEIANLTR